MDSVSQPDADPTERDGLKSIHVLHVDDDPEFLSLAEDIFERKSPGLIVKTAQSADEGLDVLETHEIDCIISDYDMPGADGIDFLKAVREIDAELPFILFTGMGSEEVASESISAGVTDYLQKAPGLDQFELLINRIRRCVGAYRAQRELEVRKRRLELALEKTNSGIWEYDIEEGTLWRHEGADEFWGTDTHVAAPLEQALSERIHPDDQEDNWAALDRALSTGDPYRSQFRLKMPSGEYRWVESRGQIVEDGAGRRMIGFVTDIEEQKDRESELAFFKELVEHAGVGMAAYTADGRFTYVNDAYASLLGYSVDALDGKAVWEVNPAVEEDRFQEYWESFGTGETRVHETTHLRADGSEIPVAVVTTQHTLQGTAYHFGTIEQRNNS